MPKLSVCLIAHQIKPDHLKACVNSILEQTLTDFELLISGMYSAEMEYEKIIHAFNDSRIKHDGNSDKSETSDYIGHFLERAQGKYIVLINTDGLSLPERFEKQVAYLDEHPECGMVDCCCEKLSVFPNEEKTVHNKQNAQLLQNSPSEAYPAAMFRKSVLLHTPLNNGTTPFSADNHALWNRLLNHTKFYHIPEVLFKTHNRNLPKISIIIPVYNVEKYLGVCLDSVLAQSYDCFEVICVNDGSTDCSLNILQEYARQDSRIKVFSQPNQGSSVARNNGLQKISGDYVCFIDADDYIEADFLADLYRAAYENHADMVMTVTKYIKADKIKRDKLITQTCLSFKDKLKALPHGGACNKIYKAQLLQNNALTFPEGLYWEDNLFTVMACFYAAKMAIINGAEYNYIDNPTSNIRNVEKIQKRKEDCLQIAKMIMAFVSAKSQDKADHEAVADFCFKSFITGKDLIGNAYYQKISAIFPDSPSLRKRRRKQRLKHFLKKILSIIKTKGTTMKTYYIVSGGFDPIHEGHVDMIKSSAQASDGVIVLVNSDDWLCRKKGKNFHTMKTRKAILENLKGVIDVLEFDDTDNSACDGIQKARAKYPDAHLVFANGGDRKKDNIPEVPICKACQVDMAFGVGGDNKANSSSWILDKWKK